MKDLRQIRLIAKTLAKQKEGNYADLAQINNILNTRIQAKNKMLAYQNEYNNDNNLTFTKATPALSKNFYSFTKRIEIAICKVEEEIENLIIKKQIILQKITDINKKLELMKVFENKINVQAALLAEKKEQSIYDLISSTRKIRDEHE